jgi:hypothetical protein
MRNPATRWVILLLAIALLLATASLVLSPRFFAGVPIGEQNPRGEHPIRNAPMRVIKETLCMDSPLRFRELLNSTDDLERRTLISQHGTVLLPDERVVYLRDILGSFTQVRLMNGERCWISELVFLRATPNLGL